MNAAEKIFEKLLPDIVSEMHAEHCESGYALPDATLNALSQLVKTTKIRRVFEFGSGRSTKAFLEHGCWVTTLEDSRHWLNQTLEGISVSDQARLDAAAQPMTVVWHGGGPFRSWKLSAKTGRALRAAELVLIDSPSFPPFREHALILSLIHATNAVVVIDDANIPTIKRFCERISALNPSMSTFYTPKDHGLFFFARSNPQPLRFRRGLIETCKTWRRFFLAERPVQASTKA